MKNNRVISLFGIEFPIIQAGMIWCSGWELASAVSNAGGLGLIGSGSMYPDILRDHIRKCKAATNKPFGVNLPLLYPQISDHISIILEEGVKVVFTSAGNPKTYAGLFKENGVTVVHVVSSSKFAIKAQEAGCDAVVAEGFEAGGHNGREETTTLCLIPAVVDAVKIPVIAAGGIHHGRSMAAAFALGAEAVQVGSRFVASLESSAHQNFKNSVIQTSEGDTRLTLKEITPVRLIKNAFYQRVEEAYTRGAGIDELKELLGRGRAKKGMFEGDLNEGELEIGQASAMFNDILPAADIVKNMMQEFKNVVSQAPRWLDDF
ncbi:MAG: nitronate monooxygenase [Flavobacteriales bacterium]|nr:nitronate monooxygenase [Flavobacteriales bacterium]